MKNSADLYRELPSVDELLRLPDIAPLIAEDGQATVTDACRNVVNTLRAAIADGDLGEQKLPLALSGIARAVRAELARIVSYSLLPVINATGVILHTNLGRAPLGEFVIEHIRETAGAYSNLEFDIASGERGKRDAHADRLFRKLLDGSQERGGTGVSARVTSGISTIVVNNNAAAVLLALNTFADGGEVIVSRGELVEIGGSFRIPDVMAKSGALLREVGTTNRTRVSDYENAINERTKLFLRVHRSNFEISGFTEEPTIQELVALAVKHKLPLMEDLGSGALFDLRTVGISNEPSVPDSLRAGVHIVTYSGDKLLGGPQAGLISGREDLVRRMRNNSLFRALRVDKLTYAALEATLLAYVKRDYNSVPALRMMQLSKREITKRAEFVVSAITGKTGEGVRSPEPGFSNGLAAELIDGESLIGGGSAPSAALPTTLIALTSRSLSADELAARLRGAQPAVIARVEDGRVLLDLRTVFPAQDEIVVQILDRVASD
jgi:L-seryl-tRNA(Ser) seleniumtransferase